MRLLKTIIRKGMFPGMLLSLCVLWAAQASAQEAGTFTLTNRTGMDIIYLSVKDDAAVAFGDNLLEESKVLKDQETAEFRFETEGLVQPLLLGVLFDTEPRVQAIMHAFPFDMEENASLEILIAEGETVFAGDTIAYVRDAEEGTDPESAFSTMEDEIKAYKENQVLYLLPDPEASQGKDADEGCIGDEGLFN